MNTTDYIRSRAQELREAAQGLDEYVAQEGQTTRYVLLASLTDVAYEMRMAAVSLAPAPAAAEFYLDNAQRGLDALFSIEGIATSRMAQAAREAVEIARSGLRR